MRWDRPAILEVLFASRNGLFPWAPACVLALVGLVLALRRSPRLGAVLLSGFVLQLLVNAAAWDWWSGGSFGARRFDSCFVAFAFGAAAFARAAAAGHWSRRVPAAAACLALLLLAIANTAFAAASNSFSVPNAGLGPASAVLRRRIPGPLGTFAGWASALSNYPVRLAFSLRHGTSMDAYDRVEGYYFLKDQCPCMEPGGKLNDQLRLDAPSPFVVSAGSETRILVPLNVRGGVSLALEVKSGAPGKVEVSWNGDPVAAETVGAGPGSVKLTADRVRRGVNVLTVRAPPTTRLQALQLKLAQ
jgi:hypothetical protein